MGNRFWPGFDAYAEGLVSAETTADQIERMCAAHTHEEDTALVLPGAKCLIGDARPNGPIEDLDREFAEIDHERLANLGTLLAGQGLNVVLCSQTTNGRVIGQKVQP